MPLPIKDLIAKLQAHPNQEALVQCVVWEHESGSTVCAVQEVKVVDDFANPFINPQPRGALKGLSKRELEVLTLFAQGKRTKDIAWRLGIAVRTVGVHKFNLCRKLGLRTTVGMLRYCQMSGLA